jgi:hypothetical protein
MNDPKLCWSAQGCGTWRSSFGTQNMGAIHG